MDGDALVADSGESSGLKLNTITFGNGPSMSSSFEASDPAEQKPCRLSPG
jgi:hypothetical protein